jgi:hypothetical protein
MSEELFDVVFFGILQTGKDKDTVMQNMAKIFKTDAAKLAPYFAGGRKVIKGKVNADMAAKYQAALENAGLVIKLEACAEKTEEDSTPTAPTSSATKQPQTTATQSQPQSSVSETDTSGISMAPVGADVLEHPVEVAAQKIDDISDITMAETGADVLEHPVETPAQKIEDISDITMAEVGADVLEHSEKVIPQQIDDISSITMAEPGADIIENPKPAIKADIPDTSELSLD